MNKNLILTAYRSSQNSKIALKRADCLSNTPDPFPLDRWH